LSVNEAAQYLCCSRQRIYDLASSGRLPRVKEGRRLLFRRSDLEKLLSG
jgi:excisionase family DNA binding protein